MSLILQAKAQINELAVFGSPPLFATAKSTSNLVKPDFDTFLRYSKIFHDKRRYTNDGSLVKLLEQRLAEFHGAKFCVSFCSGFWALALTISVLATKGKSEIIMPSLTYRRMSDIAAWVGLTPRFCEVDPDTLAVSATTVAACMNDKTALILGVHPIVNCCDVEGLIDLAEANNIPLLFDSVESVYETIPTGKIGSFGHAEVFSLHASKLLNGFEGGYVTTNDAALARELALLHGFGFEGPDNIVFPGGLNAKLNEIHAAMALASLDDLEAQVDRNRERYQAYQQTLAEITGLRLLAFDETEKTSYKNIVIELLPDWPLSRADTLRILNAENILARAYYTPPLHHKAMAYPHIECDLPVTDQLAERFVLMPCGHFVTTTDIEAIVTLLKFMADHADSIKQRLAEQKASAHVSR